MPLSTVPLVRHVAQQVRRALDRSRVHVSSRAYRHLVGVVCLPVEDRWFRSHGIFEPLSQWYRRGLTHPIQSVERAYILGFVGDAALLLCGFWWEERELQRVEPGIDELVKLGTHAYRNIGDDPYVELSGKYSRVADAMMVMAAHYHHDRDRRIVSLCRAWERNHDQRTARVLGLLGLPPGFLQPGRPS